MTSALATTGLTGNTYKALFRKQILRVKPYVVGMAVAAAIRVRGRGGVPPHTGGWRELRDDELA